MGAYLSQPVTEKISSDEVNEKLECGASSMQGWRVNQEDAHNTILDFDENTSLFAVYDGHGGAEVATYCSQNLPNFIKNTDAYKNGDMNKALTDAFLGFDATIATKEVMEILKELAGEINPPGPSDNEESDDENISNLYKDAGLPLQEVLAKYENKWSALHRTRVGDTATPLSPCLRAKKNFDDAEGSGAGASSSSAEIKFVAGSSSEKNEDEATSSINGLSKIDKSDEDTGGVSSSNCNDDKEVNGVVSTSEQNETAATSMEVDKVNTPDSSGENCNHPEQSADSKSTSEVCNGEVTNSKIDGENNISSSNGSATPVKSDVTKGGEVDSSDEEQVNGVGESSNDEADEDDDDDDDDAESSGDEREEDINLVEEPGSDSGCTAVVALLKGNELYVANAGDSRCIICREGKAIDMSIDHKPEDSPELERITKAGGKVSSDGRINGGLNLSRAIGDHSYKQNKELNAKEQMITALPDVKTLQLEPEKDQFMVLACDGIWNFMSSQDVCDFILPRLAEGRDRLSQICEEMFDHCLAPSTMGDGTGCDNMTAIIVRFKDGVIGDVGQYTTESKKRTADEEPNDDQQDTKRPRIDDSLSSSIVTSTC
ncbi:unnamed protein product [Danaus chrysippus]|uniref:protein-serine/threonine phosphatase n=1 Tax=Danaus chrysippus TaxID=151541 RepID=A0A8J2R8F9_9NEOP|nr:unnamed protein product [Danaus chrysippus]